MSKDILTRNYDIYQLISIGIELSHRVMCLEDCAPSLLQSTKHLSKINELAHKWNKLFIETVVPKTLEGRDYE